MSATPSSQYGQWHYFLLSITPDPRLQKADDGLYEALDVDLLTWRSLIQHCLFALYGIVGEARHFDILMRQSSSPALDCIVRIQQEDEEMFLKCFANYSFALNNYFGQKYDGVNARICVKNHSAFLGALPSIELV
ncbi:putative mitochondrial zinc maintenance protein [Clavispora lusitaniae]|uniref:Mitochondrial zinc maintenance protein n=1 Tax=Clavispora lusitaniae TaxID=36911 RepID=A0ACD0WII5_CLALS|nr:putative mitochondrial zinc maintenance protein [Clavispora lusitaniae]QFZ33410.1 putative mitochondrial zinc maintenance protein [Clavispora lusitaniae]QFZ39081.1 putative mitochondrial zinc maintenance protein [Clavispora lusitaniae]QFZ44763.1 putative mitochondrial zinc maintenance protein [Clavispora lusitaniae]QFZ50440.1 putative mitochondrial zinc maintenance protein [Clavispora lusitaniae]